MLQEAWLFHDEGQYEDKEAKDEEGVLSRKAIVTGTKSSNVRSSLTTRKSTEKSAADVTANPDKILTRSNSFASASASGDRFATVPEKVGFSFR